ncbi:MAG: hypothetical protein HYV25_00310 [Candidatus Harrisonbacteria bacterium]|nr:hypothetical protein [Candidatus Harrisonbacteria bacterium]
MIEKNEVPYGKRGAERHISRHHFFPQRLKKYFSDKEIKKYFDIDEKSVTIKLCYECHEEMIHNIVLSPKIIRELKKKMTGKPIQKRIVIFFKQLN